MPNIEVQRLTEQDTSGPYEAIYLSVDGSNRLRLVPWEDGRDLILSKPAQEMNLLIASSLITPGLRKAFGLDATK